MPPPYLLHATSCHPLPPLLAVNGELKIADFGISRGGVPSFGDSIPSARAADSATDAAARAADSATNAAADAATAATFGVCRRRRRRRR